MTRLPGSRSPKVIERYPAMVTGFMEGRSLEEIGGDYGVGGYAIMRNARNSDFQEYLEKTLLAILKRIDDNIRGLEDSEDGADRREATRSLIRLFGILYPRRLDVTTKSFRYELTEDRRAFRENFGKLSREEQEEYIKLWRKMNQPDEKN